MNLFNKLIHTLQYLQVPFFETLYLTIIPLTFASFFGLLIGIYLFCSEDGLIFEDKPIHRITNKLLNIVINTLRSIPYIILLVLLIPITLILVGSFIGKQAALPSLIVSATPFFARMCVIAFKEVNKGTIEASKAMGANTFQIITKVLIPESLPALISAVSVLGINLVGYTAMAGAIGAGGLGYQAYQYGFIRKDYMILYVSTILILVIVFIIQAIGDYLTKKVDKR